MKDRIFTLILVVAVGVSVGVGIVLKQSKEALIQEVLKRQNIILQGQNKIAKHIARQLPKQITDKISTEIKMQFAKQSVKNKDTFLSGDPQVNSLFRKQQTLEQRIFFLESQMQKLRDELKQAKGLGAAGRPAGPPPEDLSTVHDIPVDHSVIIGSKNAPVTIVEFVDFQCPFCARFHGPVEDVAKAFPAKVNYMVKNFPLGFHPQAKPAAKAAFAAGEQGKYKEMVGALLKNGKSLSDDKFKELAKELGLNVKKFLRDYKDKDAQWEKYIQADMALGRKVGVRGTPTFYINGRKTNARDLATYKREIESILKEKK